MFRTFVIIAEIILLVAVLRSSFVQYWFSDIQNALSEWMIEVSMIGEREMLSEFRGQVLPNMGELKQYQQEYFDQLLASKSKLNTFHLKYCTNGDKNPHIHGVKLHYFCTALEQSKLLH